MRSPGRVPARLEAGDSVRALPLWQPWASLVVHGAKRIETRHWRPPLAMVGERIAIHATKARHELWRVDTQRFDRVLRGLVAAGAALMDPGDPRRLPLGALLGTVVLTGCDLITEETAERLRAQEPDEHAFGDYTPGRFAWRLVDPVPLAEPVPWRGSQGLFVVPASVVGVEPSPPAQGRLL